MTNVFELPLQQWGACSYPGHGGGWFGGFPSELREDHLPNHPMGHLHCCCQARAFAFIQLNALNINKQWGLTFPSTSTPAATASGKPTSARVPAGTSPCFPSAPRAGVQWLVHFLPLFSIPGFPVPSPGDPAPQHQRACPAEQAQGLGGHLPAWAALGHLLAPCLSSPICQALDNTVTGPKMGKE